LNGFFEPIDFLSFFFFKSFDFFVTFLDSMAPRKVAASKEGAKRGGGAAASSSRFSPAAVGAPADVPMIVGEFLIFAG
jgi:hypothetical protein